MVADAVEVAGGATRVCRTIIVLICVPRVVDRLQGWFLNIVNLVHTFKQVVPVNLVACFLGQHVGI